MERHEALAGRFEANRSHLTAVAYRMLGSPSETEDAVQEAWLRLGVSQPRPTHPASRRVHQHPNLPHRLKTPTDAESPPSPAAPEPPPTQDHTPTISTPRSPSARYAPPRRLRQRPTPTQHHPTPIKRRPRQRNHPHRRSTRADVLVVVEDVVGVVRGLHVHQPFVDGVAVRLADSVGVFVATEEVDVDAFPEPAEGGEEPPRPGGVPVAEVLAGPPHTIEGDRVRRLPVPERRPALGHSAHRPLQMEHRHVRPWRRGGERVLGDDLIDVIAELGDVGGLPVVVPTVFDGRVERALESHVRRWPDQVEEGSPGCAERTERLQTVLDRAGVAGTYYHHRAPVQILGDDR